MTSEFMLTQSGDFGPAQWLLLALFCLVNVATSFHYFAQTFINLVPKDWCDYQHCINDTSLESSIESNQTYACNPYETSPWHFETLTLELGWVCEHAWIAAVVQSMFFLGCVCGTLTLGFLSDTVGRLPMMIVANLLAALGNLLTVFLPANEWWLGAARFIAGLATDTNFFMMYIIVMEYVRPSMRTTGLNLSIGVWYCVGCMITPWVALYSHNWRSYLLVVALLSLVIPIVSFAVPESAQWLMSRGRTEDAIKCFRKVAVMNRREISMDLISEFRVSSQSVSTSKSQGSLAGLFTTPNLRRKTLILIFKTMVLTLCYDAMARNIEGLGVNPFSMFTISSATIFPSCIVILLLQDRLGRKIVAVVSLILTGFFNFGQGALIVFCTDAKYMGAVVGMCGRLAINIAYNSGTQYAAELIPTQVRGQGLAAIHVVGYSAAFFSPYILSLASRWIAIPELILGLLSIMGAGFCLFLPETLNQSLPATLEEGEAFGENEEFWDFLKSRNYKNKLNSEASNTYTSNVYSTHM